jgi:uncharacterized membrane protein YedE/YeeE
MIDWIGEANTLMLFGLLGGVALGLAARLGRFCTLGAIEDLLYGGSSARAGMWLVALGTAILGTFGLQALGALDTADSFYLAGGFNPLASIVGGLAFGYGMAISGNCGFGALARLGGGDLRSFVIVMVMGLAAYVTLSGPLAPLRVSLFSVPDAWLGVPGLAQIVERSLHVPAATVGVALGLAALAAALRLSQLRAAPMAIFWGAVVGLAIVSGWWGTALVARVGFAENTVISHTFAAPVGETLLYLMTSTGSALSFGIGSVAGVLIGAFVGSLFKGHFRWEACDDPRELRRQIGGAVLMGWGAVTALGCSIGQSLSAMSVLSLNAPITTLAILAGATLGLRQLVSGFRLGS